MTRFVVALAVLLGFLGSSLSAASASGHDRPSAPSDVQASAGSASAVVSWEEPSSSQPLTYYWVEAYREGRRVDGRRMSAPATAIRFDGLRDGTTYTFTVYATNTAGDGPTSAHTRPVTPSADKPSGPPGTLASRPPEHRRATTSAVRRTTTTIKKRLTAKQRAAKRRAAARRAAARRAARTTSTVRG